MNSIVLPGHGRRCHPSGEMMSQYEYIDHVLANYFASNLGHSEEEAVEALRTHLAASSELTAGLRGDVQRALVDSTYSWRKVLVENDVLVMDDEDEARQYAAGLLGAVLR